MVTPIKSRTDAASCRSLQSIDDAALKGMPGGISEAGGNFIRPRFGMCFSDIMPKSIYLGFPSLFAPADPLDPCNDAPVDDSLRTTTRSIFGAGATFAVSGLALGSIGICSKSPTLVAAGASSLFVGFVVFCSFSIFYAIEGLPS